MPDVYNQTTTDLGDHNSLRGEFVNIGNVGAITQEKHEHHHYYPATPQAPRRGLFGLGRAKRAETYTYTPELRTSLIKTMENIMASTKRNHEQAVYLEMGLREVPSLVSPAWRRHVQGTTSERAVSEGEIPELFEASAKLVILGAPGAGKTVQLYRVCVHLLIQAAQESNLAVPIMINLAQFSSSTLSFERWLFEAMRETLARPEALCEMLYRQRHVILLFDGLDEVSLERQKACVEALNALVPQVDQMMVCSRLLEYQALPLQLSFDKALVLQPISQAQALAVLKAEGRATAGIRSAIQRDPMFAELLTTPLMLHVTLIAFANQTAVTIKGRNPDDLRQQLWDVYIARMFEQRTLRKYTPAQAHHWLRWLARTLQQQDTTTLWVERLQPRLLNQLRLFQLIWGLGVGLFLGLLGGLFAGLRDGLLGGLIAGLGGGLIAWLIARESVRLNPSVAPVEQLHWSWSLWRSAIKKQLIVVLVFGLVIGMLGVLLEGLFFGLFFGLIFGLIFGLGVGLLAGWVKRINNQTIQPNQGIRASFVNGTREGVVWGVFVGLVGGLLGGLDRGLEGGLGVGLFGVLFAGLIGGLFGGLGAFIKHYILRFLLWREGKMPLLYVEFLENCCELLLLKRFGGAYQFYHLTLRDHFADTPEQ